MKNHISEAILVLALALLASACGEKLSSEDRPISLASPANPTEAEAIVTFISPVTSPAPSPSKTHTPLIPTDTNTPNPTPTISPSPSPLPSPTNTSTPEPTPTPSATSTPTPSPTTTPSPSPSPSPTTTPTPQPTPTPTATSTPTPTRPAPTPTASPAPSDAVELTAWVDNPTPEQNRTVTVYGKLTVGNVGVPGLEMRTTWHYKTTTSHCTGTTDASGVARCSRRIGRATRGYRVEITVHMVHLGKDYTASTSFTPR